MAKQRTPSQYHTAKAILDLHPSIYPDRSLRLLCEHVLHRLVGWPVDPRQPGYEATSHLVDAYERDLRAHPPCSDLLGAIYMDLGGRWSRASMAQYFTPTPVAKLLASINLHGTEIPSDRYLRLLEPSVGSGAMLLAAIEVLVETHGPASLRQISLTAIDLDQLCCRMAAAQILASVSMMDAQLGELIVLHGDALGRPEDLVPIIHCSDATPPNWSLIDSEHIAAAPKRAASGRSATSHPAAIDA